MGVGGGGRQKEEARKIGEQVNTYKRREGEEEREGGESGREGRREGGRERERERGGGGTDRQTDRAQTQRHGDE